MSEFPMNRRHFVGLGAAGLAAAGLGMRPAQAQVTGTLRVSTFRQASYFTAYYLQQLAPAGLTIEIVETKSNSDALDALLTGNTDIAYMGCIGCVIAVAGGRPRRWNGSAGSKTTRILARTDSDIKELKDLKGRDVAIAKGTNQDIIFRELIRTAGLDPMKDINYVLLPSESHVEAMATGTVVACATTEPYGSLLIMNGTARELVTEMNNTRVGNPGILVATTQESIEKRPEMVQAMVSLHARTIVWMKHHMDQVVADFAKLSRQKEDVIKMAMSNTAHHYNIDDKYLSDISGLVSSLVDWKYMPQPFDAKQAFDLQFLPAARAAAGETY